MNVSPMVPACMFLAVIKASIVASLQMTAAAVGSVTVGTVTVILTLSYYILYTHSYT